ncbi:MAG: TetR/AcrR family transcriptional regulator [Planctomycetaceae bacterium]|nr:TetR/AcrR family transcriptional regulator [Planctomycetaceae bacterium]
MARPQTISNEQIIETARECYLEHGAAVSTDVIAERLGVSAQALLKRFGTKTDLLIAAMRPPARAPWVPVAEAGPDDRPVDKQLAGLLEQIAVYFDDLARRMAVLRWSQIDLAQVISGYSEPPPLVSIRTLAGWLERCSARGLLQTMDYQATSMMLLSALHGPTMLTDILGQHPTGHSRRQYVRLLVRNFLQGLAVTSPSVSSHPISRSEKHRVSGR